MNKHFEDTGYYLRRATVAAADGVAETLEPVVARVRALTGREVEREPTRIEAIRADLRETARRVADEARRAVSTVRTRFGRGRPRSD